MREMEIDMTTPASPVLWVKGKPIKMYGWKKVTPSQLISKSYYGKGRKAQAVGFYREYGVTAKIAAKFLNDGLIKMSLGAVKGHEPLCYLRSKFHSTRTIEVCEMKDELDQALADGNKNITPFIARMQMTPKELKKHFGDAAWKAICKNSFSRNRCIADEYKTRNKAEFDSKDIHNLLKVPSSLFRKEFHYGLDAANYIHQKCGFSIRSILDNKNEVFDIAKLLRDTRFMAINYEQKFSLEWSWRKMQEKHDEYAKIAITKEAERRKAQNEKYSGTLREGKQTVWQIDDVTATFLDTFDKILDEGRRMHHCVGMYAGQCFDDDEYGVYCVVHLEGDGDSTTLGIRKSPVDKFYSIDQHYGVTNVQVKSEKHRVLAKNVVDFLNNENFSKEQK